MIETYCKNAQPSDSVTGGHQGFEADTAKIPLVDEMPMVF
jgi:hypothetical protein